ncbi:hypothetical protein AB0N20_22715 [Streptomyces griseoincarnatus]
MSAWRRALRQRSARETHCSRSVRDRHQANLMYVLDDLPGWTRQVAAELAHT